LKALKIKNFKKQGKTKNNNNNRKGNNKNIKPKYSYYKGSYIKEKHYYLNSNLYLN